jgi:hypothetical protein
MFRHVCVLLFLVLTAGCVNNTVIAPSTTPPVFAPSTTPSVTINCSTMTLTATGQQTPCSAVVLSNGTSQDQTLASQWSSSNASVASVSATGMVTAVSNGASTITATFQGLQGARAVVVTIPAPVAPSTFVVNGTLTDGTSHGILPGLTIQLLSGTSVVTSTLTDSGGNYTISGVSAATFTLSVSAVSYVTTTQQVTVPPSQQVNLVLQRAPVSTPVPTAQCLPALALQVSLPDFPSRCAWWASWESAGAPPSPIACLIQPSLLPCTSCVTNGGRYPGPCPGW